MISHFQDVITFTLLLPDVSFIHVIMVVIMVAVKQLCGLTFHRLKHKFNKEHILQMRESVCSLLNTQVLNQCTYYLALKYRTVLSTPVCNYWGSSRLQLRE